MDYVRTGNFSLSNIGFFRQEQRRESDGATLGRYLLSRVPCYSLATIGKVILVLGADTLVAEGREAETVDKLLLFPLP